MPETGTSGSMSGDGKRGVGHRPQVTAPILDSTISSDIAPRANVGVQGNSGRDKESPNPTFLTPSETLETGVGFATKGHLFTELLLWLPSAVIGPVAEEHHSARTPA